MNALERIMDDIKRHDAKHPDHGVGCACHDQHAGTIRRLVAKKRLTEKSKSNLLRVFTYVTRSL